VRWLEFTRVTQFFLQEIRTGLALLSMKTFRRLSLLLALLCVVSSVRAQSEQHAPDIVLAGKVTGSQDKTHFEIPFDVPANIHRISVDFDYTGKEEKTVLDLGIADPERFRGASGGNKGHFTISETDATPSYLPGAILRGQWKLLISVPNIRPQSASTYRAEIRFNARTEDGAFSLAPLADGMHWYRGDLHMHTAHSDGSCLSQSGKRVPCPVFLTAQKAAERRLDFIAITDHNTDSQYDEMRELQPYFDRLLLIPGREMTTFWGHFNVFGVTGFMDYRVVERGGLSVDKVVQEAAAKGGIASVNHADSPGGESCMGCAWEPSTPVNMSQFTAIEVINGGRVMLSSADMWEKQLHAGLRLTAIGGSDNHNAPAESDQPGAIGHPTTVIEARELSVPAILDGIRAGHVFIDLTASHDKLLELDARDGNAEAHMGDTLAAGSGEVVKLELHVVACPQAIVQLMVDGKARDSPMPVAGVDETLNTTWTSDGDRHWIRGEVRDSTGKLLLLGNPVYINFAAR
jgi:hypothetical protein